MLRTALSYLKQVNNRIPIYFNICKKYVYKRVMDNIYKCVHKIISLEIIKLFLRFYRSKAAIASVLSSSRVNLLIISLSGKTGV